MTRSSADPADPGRSGTVERYERVVLRYGLTAIYVIDPKARAARTKPSATPSRNKRRRTR